MRTIKEEMDKIVGQMIIDPIENFEVLYTKYNGLETVFARLWKMMLADNREADIQFEKIMLEFIAANKIMLQVNGEVKLRDIDSMKLEIMNKKRANDVLLETPMQIEMRGFLTSLQNLPPSLFALETYVQNESATLKDMTNLSTDCNFFLLQ